MLKVEPEIASLEPGEVQARVDAVAAAFGGKLLPAELGARLAAVPEVLTSGPSDISASHSRLAELGLTAEEAAAVLTAQPHLLLASRNRLCNIAENLQISFRLSPRRLRGLIVEMPECLRYHCGREVADGSRRVLHDAVAKSFEDSALAQLEHIIESAR